MNSSLYFHRSTCRLCDSSNITLAVPYPATPIADAYVSAQELYKEQQLYPLDLYLCLDCGHVQLCDVLDPDELFRNYTYETSVSLGLVEHFRTYADEVFAYCPPPEGSLVVEIGSNDGSLLRFFKQKGLQVLGVDPALKVAKKATAAGIETIPDFFSRNLAREIKEQHGVASIIAANNVFAHSDSIADMAAGIHDLLDREGIFVFEVSYLPYIIENKLFDTIYHEHLCYHTVKPLQQFFRRHGLELIDFKQIATKGGSFRGIVRRSDGGLPMMPSVLKQIEIESVGSYASVEPYRLFAEELGAVKENLTTLLVQLKKDGASLAGYGASATVTTLIYYFGLENYLDYLVDDNPGKHGTYSPGVHLPVFPSQTLYDKKPDYVIVLAWNYADPIIKRHEAFRDAGGRFIVPLPEVRII